MIFTLNGSFVQWGALERKGITHCLHLHQEVLKISEKEGSKSDSGPDNRIVEEKSNSASTQVKSALPDCSRSSTDSYTNPNQTGSTPSPKRKNKVDESCTTVPSESAPSTTTSRGVSLQLPVEQDKGTTASAPIELTSNSMRSDDVQLVIRMPNGPSVQIKLTKEDVLRKVKNFVDENQASGVGSYDLAMLFPISNKSIFPISNKSIHETRYRIFTLYYRLLLLLVLTLYSALVNPMDIFLMKA